MTLNTANLYYLANSKQDSIFSSGSVGVFHLSSPCYNRTGWLGVKHQVTDLLTSPIFIFFVVNVLRCPMLFVDGTIHQLTN